MGWLAFAPLQKSVASNQSCGRKGFVHPNRIYQNSVGLTRCSSQLENQASAAASIALARKVNADRLLGPPSAHRFKSAVQSGGNDRACGSVANRSCQARPERLLRLCGSCYLIEEAFEGLASYECPAVLVVRTGQSSQESATERLRFC